MATIINVPPKNQEICHTGEKDSSESVEIRLPRVFKPEVLGKIACYGAAFEDKERADLSVGLLDDMRMWLHESAINLLRVGQAQGWQERYPVLFDKMNNIHQAVAAIDPENLLLDHAPVLLLANYLRYLDSNNLDTELTSGQLAALYGEYSSDVEICRDIKIPDPERVACHQGGRDLSRLIDKYGGFDFVRGDDFVKAISNYVRSPEMYFERLIRDVTYFQTISEPGLREEYGFSGEPWTSTFIAGLSRRFSDVEQAARNIFELIPKLRNAYRYATEDTIERWAKQIITEQQSKRRVEIDELLKEAPVITIENSERELAAEALSQVRHALLSGELRANASNRDSAGVHRLVRVAEANWHESFEEVDMHGAARNIYFMIKAYNAFVKKTKPDAMSSIPMTAASLYNILVVFASDISALKKEVAPSKAAKVARYHSPGVCERLYEQFQEKNVPVSVISSLIANNPRRVTGAIKEYKERSDILKEMLRLEKLIGLHSFALLDDGPERAQKYLTFLPTARERYHWVSRADVAEFFYSSDTPEAQFNIWAEKVDAIRERTNPDANRTNNSFSVFVVKKLAKDKEHTIDTIIKTHTEKCNALYAPYKDNSFVTRAMVSLWVIRRDVPEDAIEEYLKRVDEVEELLVKAGEDDSDSILVRDLAFYSNNPQKMVARYLDTKKVLELERETWGEEYNDIERWMIVQVASRSSQLEYARHKLKILAWMTRRGRLLPVSKPAYEQKSQLVEKMAAEKDYSSFAGLNHAAALVENLHELDRMAVLMVFGFDEEYGGSKIDAKWLEGELGVSNLEAYVMEEVVPHIRSTDSI